MIEAFVEGRDQMVIDLHAELNESQELFLEVWGTLPSTMRRSIKLIIDGNTAKNDF